MADVIVSTFTRGGSSLVMQMLHAGGMPCLGAGPAFEDDRVSARGDGRLHLDWIADVPGAVKVLEPQRAAYLPPGLKLARLGIWLDRDPVTRAKSALRLMDAGGLQVANRRQTIRAMATSYERDRLGAIDGLKRLCGHVLRVRFEHIIFDPDGWTDALCAQFEVGALTKAKMRAVIRTSRGTGLAPQLLEPQLIRDWEAAHG